jgi:TusA-related sulfurtransferase
MTADLTQLKGDVMVDARGTSCPGPLIEAKRKITEIPVGSILEVLSSDAGTTKDIPQWAKKVGHDYLGAVEEAGYYKVFVRRKR